MPLVSFYKSHLVPGVATPVVCWFVFFPFILLFFPRPAVNLRDDKAPLSRSVTTGTCKNLHEQQSKPRQTHKLQNLNDTFNYGKVTAAVWRESGRSESQFHCGDIMCRSRSVIYLPAI